MTKRWALVLLAVLPALLVSLQATYVLPMLWQTIPLSGFQPGEGTSYTAPLDTVRFPHSDNPPEILLEDGRPSPFPPSPGWGVVSTVGLGRYHVSSGLVYVSASDNSDPRSNGRRYEILRPTPVKRWMFAVAWLLTLVLLISQAATWFPALFAFLAAPPFWAVAAIMTLIIVANRLWLFVDFPLVAIHPDSGSYYAVAEQLGTGVLPNFGNRPPLYPIFLKLVFSIADRALFMSFCQMALSLGSAMLVAYGVSLWKKPLGLFAGLWMSFYLLSVTTMEHDSAMLSESLYASCLMFAFGALLVGLHKSSAAMLALASTGFALAIMTRPAGMFLVVSYALILGWLLYRKYGRRAIIAFALPLPVLMLSMSAYNLRVVRAFAPTTWGEANLAVATFLYWEQDPSYPPEINADIATIRGLIAERYEITKLDRSVLDRTWDPDLLAPIFVQSFNGPALDVSLRMGGHYETSARSWIRRIAFDSIRKHPDYYAKFFATMMWLYFTPGTEFDFRAYLLNRAQVMYVDKLFSPARGNEFMVRLGKEFATGSPPKHVIVVNDDPAVEMSLQDRILLPSTRLWRVYHLTYVVRRALGPSWIWPTAFVIALFASTFVLLKSRFRHEGAFVVFILTISAFGASLVVSLVEYSQPRYSYPMEWTYGLGLVLLPLLWMRARPGKTVNT